ncbi:MAG: dihydrodipicolinate reductase C-terminal domain-containing protein [Balneolaceae bacterium]
MSKNGKELKYAVIGTGKTGGTVLQKLEGKSVAFDEYNKPTADKLADCDVAIIFVPGSAAQQVVEIVLEAGINAIWGTTGYEWPATLSDQVKKKGVRWVIGSNFSMGMNLVRKAIHILGQGSDMLPNPKFHIHEVHHINKQDAPSGTAISWSEWLKKDAVISSDRQGDVKGIHNLHIKTEGESIYLKHEAHSRDIFADGAIWSANYIMNNRFIEPGLYQFSDLFDKAFAELL